MVSSEIINLDWLPLTQGIQVSFKINVVGLLEKFRHQSQIDSATQIFNKNLLLERSFIFYCTIKKQVLLHYCLLFFCYGISINWWGVWKDPSRVWNFKQRSKIFVHTRSRIDCIGPVLNLADAHTFITPQPPDNRSKFESLQSGCGHKA